MDSTPDDHVVELEIPARPEYLALARLMVASAAELDPTARPERVDDLRLLVSEAATNAIAAQSALGRDERFVIRCDLDDDRIEVLVRDRGGGFDPGEVGPPPTPDDPARLQREGGFGLPLIQRLADEAEIAPSGEGTDVRLVVYTSRSLRPRPGPPAGGGEARERGPGAPS